MDGDLIVVFIRFVTQTKYLKTGKKKIPLIFIDFKNYVNLFIQHFHIQYSDKCFHIKQIPLDFSTIVVDIRFSVNLIEDLFSYHPSLKSRWIAEKGHIYLDQLNDSLWKNTVNHVRVKQQLLDWNVPFFHNQNRLTRRKIILATRTNCFNNSHCSFKIPDDFSINCVPYQRVNRYQSTELLERTKQSLNNRSNCGRQLIQIAKLSCADYESISSAACVFLG